MIYSLPTNALSLRVYSFYRIVEQFCDTYVVEFLKLQLIEYLNEFDFRYNNRSRLGIEDEQRTANALKGIVGKRLTYRYPNGTAAE